MSIVVGYVSTAEGNAALERSVQESRIRASALVVVDLSRPAAATPELQHRMEDLAGSDVSFTVRAVPEGTDAVDALLDVASEVQADLLIIGLRRRTPVGKLILGAQAQRILLDAACPVLAVKPAATQAR